MAIVCEGSMRPVSVLLFLIALSACGCSKSKPNPVAPAPAPDSRGTPLGAAYTFTSGGRLLWSAATNEIVGAGTGGLLAMHGLTGVTRVLDPAYTLWPLAASAGTPIYYETASYHYPGNDTIAFRRVALAGGPPELVDIFEGVGNYEYAISGDGAWLAWHRRALDLFNPDSTVIEEVATGDRSRIEPGTPLLMSPDGSKLLYRTSIFLPEPKLYDRISGTNLPFTLGLPEGAEEAGLSWDDAGVHVLYVMNGKRLEVLHIATGRPEDLYNSSDTLVAESGTWSADGSHVALWSVFPSIGIGDSHKVSLHVVDVAAKRGWVVAVGTLHNWEFSALDPGHIVFSPDSKRVACDYGGHVFTSAVPRVVASSGARPSLAGGGPWRRAQPGVPPQARRSRAGRPRPAGPTRRLPPRDT